MKEEDVPVVFSVKNEAKPAWNRGVWTLFWFAGFSPENPRRRRVSGQPGAFFATRVRPGLQPGNDPGLIPKT